MAWNKNAPTTTQAIRDAVNVLQNNWQAIEDWTDTQHYGLASAASGSHLPGRCSMVAVVDTTEAATLANVACAFGFNTDNNDFYYNDGTTWVELGGTVPSGTNMLFYEDTAPTGWTILTSVDDKLVFITKGSTKASCEGGTASGNTWGFTGFSGYTELHQLSVPEMPAHKHPIYYGSTGVGVNTGAGAQGWTMTAQTTYTGGGYDGSHRHWVSTNLSGDGTWRPEAYSCIICTKD